METSVRRQGEWTVVKVAGRIQLEKTQAFRDACLQSLQNQKVIFLLDQLQFVGSTGMSEFFECLHAIKNRAGSGVKIVGLSSDFKRFVAFTKASELSLHETLDEAFKPALDPQIEFKADQISDLGKCEDSNLDFAEGSDELSEPLPASDSKNS